MAKELAMTGNGERHSPFNVTHERISLVLVDDYPAYLELICSVLEFEQRLEVIGKANDGKQALRAVRKLRPQLVLMDVNIPRMGGLRAARLIAACFPEVKIALMSAEESPLLREKCFACGAHAFISRRQFREDFAMAVEQIFPRHHATKAA